MSRPRKHRRELPRRVYFKHSAFYFVDVNAKWTRLGSNYADAMVEYAKILQADARTTTMGTVLDRYQREIVPTLASNTQRAYKRALRLLQKAFGHMKPAQVEPQDVYAYLDARKASPGSARLEKAVLSDVFSYAVEWGKTNTNPCRAVKLRRGSKARDRYVTDEQFSAVYNVAPEVLKLSMLLALITGLRPCDIVGLKFSDFTDNGLELRTTKTGKRMVYQWTPELRDIVARAKKLRSVRGVYVIINRDGQPYTTAALSAMWRRYRQQALDEGLLDESFQFRDIRAKTSSDSNDSKILGHVSVQTLNRHYKRKPYRVTPIKPKVL